MRTVMVLVESQLLKKMSTETLGHGGEIIYIVPLLRFMVQVENKSGTTRS